LDKGYDKTIFPVGSRDEATHTPLVSAWARRPWSVPLSAC